MQWNSNANTLRKPSQENSSVGTLRKASNQEAYASQLPAKLASNRPQTQNESSERRVKTGKQPFFQKRNPSMPLDEQRSQAYSASMIQQQRATTAVDPYQSGLNVRNFNNTGSVERNESSLIVNGRHKNTLQVMP